MFDTYAEHLNDFLIDDSQFSRIGYSDTLTTKEFMQLFDEDYEALILED